MKTSCEKLRLKMMHDVLDKELQQINNQTGVKTRQNLKNSYDRMKQSTDSRGSINAPISKQINNNQPFKQLTNSSASRKNQINDLQKKLMQLQKKMDCIDFQSSQSQIENNNNKVQHNNQKILHRLIIPNNKQNNSAKKKINYSDFQRKDQIEQYELKTDENRQNAQDSSEEEDSQDYFMPTVAKPIQKVFTNNLKKNIDDKKFNNKAFQNRHMKKIQNDDQVSFLKEKCSNQKKKDSSKRFMRNSQQSKKSLNTKRNQRQNFSKNETKKFSHNKSVKKNKSTKSVNSNRSRSKSQQKDHSIISGKSINSLKNQDLQINKQLKRIFNLEKQLIHYKRLSKKLQQKINDMQKIQIQYRKLKANFVKSEQIRKQQKKLIENLKTRKVDV